MSQDIHIVITGGTIDSRYDGTKDTAVPNEKTVIPEYIQNLKLYEKVIFSVICMKDSRDIGKSDLRKMTKVIEESPSKKIIVTHGTYTMPESARFLKANQKRTDQVVVFTGSLIPLVGFSPSDAGFNLGYSMSVTHTLEPGIYVCMNGSVFTPNEVVKLLKEGRFSSIFGSN